MGYRLNTSYKEIMANDNKKSSDGGNTGLPYGLCEKYDISLPADATPRQAWDALAKIGITPDKAYKQLVDKDTKPQGEQGAEATKTAANDLFGHPAPQQFHDTLASAKESLPLAAKWRVDLHNIEEYDNAKLYTTQGGSCVAVDNGNIISVCKKKGDSIRGSDLLKHAIQNGGDRLDAFGPGLYSFYTKNGFEPVSWTPFNEEYAPDEWIEARDKGMAVGKEPVLFYKYTGKVTNITYDDFIKNTKPSEDYDVAQNIRDKSMENK